MDYQNCLLQFDIMLSLMWLWRYETEGHKPRHLVISLCFMALVFLSLLKGG